MLHMLIGSAGYARLTSPVSHDIEKKADYAEHQVMDGKPVLQFIGLALDDLSLSFYFHEDFSSPQTAWTELVGMLESGTAFPVSMGDGRYLGMYVLDRLTQTASVMSEAGSLRAFECRVSLKEYVQLQPLETKEAEKKSTAGAVKKSGQKKPGAKKKPVPSTAKSGDYTAVPTKSIVRQ